jgi:hypothetical protein
MAELAGISTIKQDEDGEPYVELNPSLLKQMGWDDRTLLEWEIVGDMAIIRKKEDDWSSTRRR